VARGEKVAITGFGSFEKRGRVNSGVGYAISINQIKNFLGALRVGLQTDHASLGASMESEAEDGTLSKILVKSIIDSDARRRGLDVVDGTDHCWRSSLFDSGPQTVGAPNPVDGRLADALRLRHRPTTPVGRGGWRGLPRRIDDGFDLLSRDRGLSSSPGRDGRQGSRATSRKPSLPQDDRWPADRQPLRDAGIGFASGRQQHDLGPRHRALRCSRRPNPGFQHAMLFRSERPDAV